jgi:hypothetical protein
MFASKIPLLRCAAGVVVLSNHHTSFLTEGPCGGALAAPFAVCRQQQKNVLMFLTKKNFL